MNLAIIFCFVILCISFTTSTRTKIKTHNKTKFTYSNKQLSTRKPAQDVFTSVQNIIRESIDSLDEFIVNVQSSHRILANSENTGSEWLSNTLLNVENVYERFQQALEIFNVTKIGNLPGSHQVAPSFQLFYDVFKDFPNKIHEIKFYIWYIVLKQSLRKDEVTYVKLAKILNEFTWLSEQLVHIFSVSEAKINSTLESQTRIFEADANKIGRDIQAASVNYEGRFEVTAQKLKLLFETVTANGDKELPPKAQQRLRERVRIRKAKRQQRIRETSI